jgi:catechol 2,3-dioxygenase-like lactoylglutathione lyase family enzyme
LTPYTVYDIILYNSKILLQEESLIHQLEHVGLSVSDLERSIDFYTKNFNFKLERILEPSPDLPVGKIVGLPGCKVRIAHLSSPGAMLELFQYVEPEGKPIPSDATQADKGYIHMGFKTSELHDEYKKLSEMGVEFISEPVEIRPDVWVVYFYGPDGEVCELRQT